MLNGEGRVVQIQPADLAHEAAIRIEGIGCLQAPIARRCARMDAQRGQAELGRACAISLTLMADLNADRKQHPTACAGLRSDQGRLCRPRQPLPAVRP